MFKQRCSQNSINHMLHYVREVLILKIHKIYHLIHCKQWILHLVPNIKVFIRFTINPCYSLFQWAFVASPLLAHQSLGIRARTWGPVHLPLLHHYNNTSITDTSETFSRLGTLCTYVSQWQPQQTKWMVNTWQTLKQNEYTKKTNKGISLKLGDNQQRQDVYAE